jgi:alpha-tubulin suppressor-like RCC1 family protein
VWPAVLLPVLLTSLVSVPAAGAARGTGAPPTPRPSIPSVPATSLWQRVHHGPNGEIDRSACPPSDPNHPMRATCFARIRIDAAARSARPHGPDVPVQPNTLGDNGAYSPPYLQSAYNAPSSSAGYGKTVAVVDAYDDPDAESDLAAYRSNYGLPACTTANSCFQKVDQRGGTDYSDIGDTANGSWQLEISLDLDMVSAMCPNCHILLVEADNDSLVNLGIAVDEAVTLGADVVSNSYGATEDFCASCAKELDQHYDHPGVPITVSSGDVGFYTQYPSVSPDVIAVGGTALQQTTTDGNRNATETAWPGAGSGCSWTEPKPPWQHDSGCAMRTVADVSAVADPATPVWVYDSYPYNGQPFPGGVAQVGGTSASSPIVAAMYALANGPSGSEYQPAGDTYSQPGHLNDVTSQSDAWNCVPTYPCQAGPGYDGPTGLGSPNGVRAFQPSLPSAPQDLLTGAYGGTAVLSWSPPALNGGAAISAYRIYRADQGSSPIATVGGTVTSYIDTGLTDSTTYSYTVKAVNAEGEGPLASASATPKVLDHLVVSPASATIAAGESQVFTVEGFATANQSQSLGDETAAVGFSIVPDGSCAEDTCTASTAGSHIVTASLSGKTDTASLQVDPGPLDHLALSPADQTIVPGDSQAYTAAGRDEFDNTTGTQTTHTNFSIGPEGNCTGTSCSASVDGDHTVTGSLKYTAVAAGSPACGITTGGGLQCWGSNALGELGNPDVPPCLVDYPYTSCTGVPVNVDGLANGVTSVSSGLDNACAVVSGAAKCWGDNFNGELGNGTFSNVAVPSDVIGLTSGVTAVSINHGHGCAVVSGAAKCWGSYSYGAYLGDGTGNNSFTPVQVSGLTSGVADVEAGSGMSCALTTGGGVKCWGTDVFGELGDGQANHCLAGSPQVACSFVPVDVTGLTSGVTQIAAGGDHACALTTGGGVKCWGNNYTGQLGNGDLSDECSPDEACEKTPVDVTGLSSGVAAIAAGNSSTCALLNTGSVKCWGYGPNGALGNGATPDPCNPKNSANYPCSDVPLTVVGISDATAISFGLAGACALLTSGAVKCWGDGGAGGLGDGVALPSYYSLTPVDVLTPNGTAALHVGPPDTVIDSGPTGYVASASQEFEFHSSEPGSTFECNLDSAGWEACSSPKSYVSLPDGPHTFEVRATHPTTGTDASPASRSFTVDTTAPSVTISGPSGPTNQRQPQFNMSYSNSDVVAAGCSIDQGTPSYLDCTGSHSYIPPPLADGAYTFRIRVEDAVGHETTAMQSFSVDTVKPTVKITSIRIWHAKHKVRITFKANEPVTFRCRIDGRAFKRCTSPVVYRDLKVGKHYFLLQGTDLAGNYRYAKAYPRI